MARGKKPSFDNVMAFMSASTQDAVSEEALNLIPLQIIRPDPQQPRRLLPSDLAQKLSQNQAAPTDIMKLWQDRVAQTPDDETSATANALELRRLADSIERHGLINPITVRRPTDSDNLPNGIEYLIVTGERRYWSHILLHLERRQIHEGEQKRDPGQIKALITARGVNIRSHQLIENIMREDINAVEKAWGLWALRYELSEVTHGLPLSDDVRLVPWTQVEEALNISKQHRIRLTSVLALSDEAQQLMSHYNLAERAVRPIVQKLRDHPTLQLVALRQLIAWQHDEKGPGEAMSKAIGNLVEQLLTQGKADTSNTPSDTTTQTVSKLQKRLKGATRFLDRLEENDLRRAKTELTEDERNEVVSDLYRLRQKVDEVLNLITTN